MNFNKFNFNCSPQYIQSISDGLYKEISDSILSLPKRNAQSEINIDLFWLLCSKGWNYDTVPAGTGAVPSVFRIDLALDDIRKRNDRKQCLTSETIDAGWRSDFAKSFSGKLVQVEVQFGKVESMFKDFCGFQIAYAERRLALGIEIVMYRPMEYFAHRKNSVSGMAGFEIAQKTLSMIGLSCPIWLIGIYEE